MAAELKTDAWHRYMLYRSSERYMTLEPEEKRKEAVEAGKKFTASAYADVWAKDPDLPRLLMKTQYLITRYDPDTRQVEQFWLSEDAINANRLRPFFQFPVGPDAPLDDELAHRVGGTVLMSLVSQYPELRALARITNGAGQNLMDLTAGGKKSPFES